MKYRKKPVVIEAIRYDGTNGETLAEWCGGHERFEQLPPDPYPVMCGYIDIPTLEGTMSARVGDFIIKGVKGEFYPCRSDIFEATYEVAE